MKNKKITAIVDAPEIILTENESVEDALLKFYRALGWNGVDILDPRKVCTSKDVYNRLYDVMLEKCPNAVGIGMALVNWGPGVNDSVPLGKVHLHKGWVRSETQTEEKEAS